MANLDFDKIETRMRELALLAGAKILSIYEQPDFNTRLKADSSPLTEADEAADAIIYAGLQAAFPEIPVVTEEQTDSHSLDADLFFIVDPLDGTKEFVQRRGDFTVNIALIEGGQPVRGVVYAPAKQRMFFTRADGSAVEEAGPFSIAQQGSLHALQMRKPDLGALVVVASKSHRDQATDDYINRYAVADLRSAGSSLKFCLLAAGEADLYPRLGRTMEWDTAAGHAILQAVGGEVLDFNTGLPLRYGKPNYENPFFIARHSEVDLVSDNEN
ncbi:3'(2'),5'-bisphosphate nucleotidase CysQ [Roseinatronobacter sp.]|uniref:3'(2'),5'-bisphosphate nucleotidase CysQ n=1 Tax=Roseinatronobacter sp. TaxID=1945755 RepID=UPI0025DC49CA|nr:3'(2'),5'-bisphosphate nucleotidase CysQ [Rhodobaca sp.]